MVKNISYFSKITTIELKYSTIHTNLSIEIFGFLQHGPGKLPSLDVITCKTPKYNVIISVFLYSPVKMLLQEILQELQDIPRKIPFSCIPAISCKILCKNLVAKFQYPAISCRNAREKDGISCNSCNISCKNIFTGL